ncbi:hypothetical protein NLJ89_g2447 [Agrocybe chaxingu]|uniref:Nephrocystin 3-like N-terminal domain-containing protein n=1 Tax=Agrocybe chaxingu TaxID=84603 RepID=A0A9W8MYQ2_9AGAR|nr:hypothetical protein NLJ89_g2447 [Agrocybe chaxingu]
MHNSGERFDPPKCYPGTRVTVIQHLLDWILQRHEREFIRWLYGPAGAGKSAIMQEIAELCYSRGILIASFFFSRTAPMRSDEKRLITTIAYQLALSIPGAKPLIEKAIDLDPAFFEKSLQFQLDLLVVGPLNHLYRTTGAHPTPQPHLIVIDGLDECQGNDMQRYVLNCFLTATMSCEFPLQILISSRPEAHITTTFSSPSFRSSLVRTALDDSYLPKEDIELFLSGSIREIKDTHPLRGYIPSNWPSHDLVATLVRKSSGQFIYAATVVKFISAQDYRPDDRLDIVLGLSSSSYEGPFAELDALYSQIFSALEDIIVPLHILSYLILSVPIWMEDVLSPPRIEKFLDLRSGTVASVLNKLSSVIKLPQSDAAPVRILHASLTDFLLDKSRSGRYFLDEGLGHSHIVRMCFRQLTHGTDPWLMGYATDSLEHHYQLASPSESLFEDIVHLDLHLALKSLSESGARMLFFDRVEIFSATLREYLSSTHIPKVRPFLHKHHLLTIRKFPNHDTLVTQCRHNVERFLQSQVDLYRSIAPRLLNLLAIYTVHPTSLYHREPFSFKCDNPKTTVTWVDYLLGFAQSVRKHSNVVLRDEMEQLDDLLKTGQDGPEQWKRTLSYMKRESYEFVLTCLPRLLERAESDPHLLLILKEVTFPPPETHLETHLAVVVWAIEKYKEFEENESKLTKGIGGDQEDV